MEVFGNLDTQIKGLVDELNESDSIVCFRDLSEDEVVNMRAITEKMWCL